MPYSIVTKDGIEIPGIPDDIPPDSPELKRIVAEQRAAKRQEGMAALQQEALQQQAAEMGPLETMAVSAGRGMTTIGRGLDLAEPEPEIATQAFGELEKQRPYTTMAGEILGQTAPFLAPGLGLARIAGTGARVAATAGLGALEGGLIARGEGRSLEEQIVSGGVGGVVAGAADLVLPHIGRALGKVWRRVTGREPVGALVDSAGKPTPQMQQALDAVGISYDDVLKQEGLLSAAAGLNPEQVARKALLEEQGLQPTRAQITRKAADFMEQQDAAKTSNLVRDRLMEQNAFLTSRFDNSVLESAGMAERGGASVFDAVTDKATKLDQEISDLYHVAREAAGGKPAIDPTEFIKKVISSRGDESATEGAISSIIGNLKNKDIIDAKGKITRQIGVKEAEEIRIAMNALFDKQKPFRNMKLRELKDALDDSVFSSVGDDVFEQARSAKREFEQELSTANVSKFDTRGKNIVRDILENKYDPDKLTDSLVFSKTARADDLGKLKDYLSTSDEGIAAFNDLRAEAMSKIKELTFKGPLDENGLANMSRAGLESALERIGKKKMDVLFTADEQKFFNAMKIVARLREPVPGAALGSGPTGAAVAKAVSELKAMLRANPKFAAIAESLSFDSKGRAVIRSNPDRVIEGSTLRERAVAQSMAQPAGAFAAGSTIQERQ